MNVVLGCFLGVLAAWFFGISFIMSIDYFERRCSYPYNYDNADLIKGICFFIGGLIFIGSLIMAFLII